MTTRKKPGVAFWATVVLIAVLPIAMVCALNGKLQLSLFEWCAYLPLIALTEFAFVATFRRR